MTQKELKNLFDKSNLNTLEQEGLKKLFEDAGKTKANDGWVYQDGLPSQMAKDMPTPTKEPTIGEQVVGGLEAAATTGTALTTGALGQIYGTLKGLARELLSGKFGSQEAAKRIEETAQIAGQGLTYEPKTQTGKEYTQAVAQAAEPLTALTPATTELGALTRTVKGAAPKVEKVIPEAPKVEGEIGGTTMEGIATLSIKASQGNKGAKEELAQIVKANPEAVAAAEKIGVDLPPDILGDSDLIKQTVGLLRSQIGSEEKVAYNELVTNVVNKADEAINQLEKTDLADMNVKTQTFFNDSIKELSKSSEDLYTKTTNSIPKNTQVTLENSQKLVTSYLDDLGIVPDENGKLNLSRLTPKEKELFSLVNSDNVTYAALDRVRRNIGEAIGKIPQGIYANQADKGLLKQLYGALKQDQLDNVGSILGEDARTQLHLADRIFQKKIALENRAADLFGKEGLKSITPILQSSIKQASKGDITTLNKVLKNIPENLHKEAIGTAFSSVITKNGRFNFSNYIDVYNGLRSNPSIYNKIIKTIGVENEDLLRSLYVVSKRMKEAENKIVRTGASNQPILKKINEGTWAEKIIRFTVEQGSRKFSLGMLPVKADGLLNLLFKTPIEKTKALSELFNSQEFKELAISAVNDVPGGKQVTNLVNSKAFKDWVKSTGKTIKDPEGFILGAFTQDKGENIDENNK